MTERRANRLARETSPYLRQHADNPVDWFPWGAEAFELARHEKKPILLSVGYSACHWCHVMEHESFEDEATARLMNELFVNVKVDREERPDVDEIYMNAVQLLTGRGGWPMTVFLTPEGEPFYGGTYYPPQDRHGLPSFRRVLQAVAEAWKERPDDVRNTVGRMVGALRSLESTKDGSADLDPALPATAAAALARAYDREHGGLGRAPKFPNTMVFSLFLRAAKLTGESRFLDMTTHTLRRMAEGGIYDQLGGGFHRYSVDERWLVPHFEKMLYDNSQLASLYLEAHCATGEAFYLEVAEDILRYVTRDMRSPEGGFFSTEDADSEGVEGKFFVWDRAEVLLLLGEEAGEIFCRVYEVTEFGNFEHRNILHRTLSDEQAARFFRREPGEIAELLANARRTLFDARERRVRPFRDEKILTAWNAMMISAYADAARVTAKPEYVKIATAAIRFLEERLTRDGRLLHSWKDGVATVPAFLDDYGALGLALLDVFEATFEALYLEKAVRIGRALIDLFWDETADGFFFTASDHERLITRTKPVHDGSVPSGNSLATELCLRLHALTEEPAFLEKAEKVLRSRHTSMAENPFAHAGLLAALDLRLRGAKEIVIVASGGAAAAEGLLRQLFRTYDPNRVVFGYDPAAPPREIPPFARDKVAIDSQPTAYVCHDFTCSAPVTDWPDLRRTIEALR